MQHFRVLAFLLLPVAGLIISGCAGSAPGSSVSVLNPGVLAEFGDEQITLEDFEYHFARGTTSRTAAAAEPIEAYEDFLERYVDFRLKVAEARRLGLHEDPEMVEEIATYRRQLAQPFLMEREVLEGIVRELYDRQQEEIHASHILFMLDPNFVTPADTLAAYERISVIRDSIVTGELDFNEAARRHSQDPSAVQNSGDLGYFSGGRMIYAFENMAYNTPVGEVTPVFRTQFGYHIMYVHDRRAALGEIRASHILLRLDANASAEDSVAVYGRAEELIAMLDGGADFAEVARDHSEDPGSAQRGGDLGFFEYGRMVPEFSEGAFALENVGDISGMVRSQFGLHIIQLTETRPRQSYEESYDGLKRMAERLPRTQERRQELGQAYRDQIGSTFDTTAVLQATADFADNAVLNSISEHGFGDHSDTVFATIGDSTFVLGDFVDYVRGSRLQPQADQRMQLVDFLHEVLNERAVSIAAEGLEDRNPEFRRIMDEYADGVLLFRIAEDSVWAAAGRDTLGLRNHYEQNAERYQYPERLRVIGFYSRSDSLLAVAESLIGEGHTPAETVEALGDPEAFRPPVRTDTLYLTTPTGGVFDSAFDLEPGQVAPVVRHRGEYMLLKLDGIEEPRGMTFDEARAHVITEYQDVLEERFVQRLRSNANVRIYPERLSRAFADVRTD